MLNFQRSLTGFSHAKLQDPWYLSEANPFRKLGDPSADKEAEVIIKYMIRPIEYDYGSDA